MIRMEHCLWHLVTGGECQLYWSCHWVAIASAARVIIWNSSEVHVESIRNIAVANWFDWTHWLIEQGFLILISQVTPHASHTFPKFCHLRGFCCKVGLRRNIKASRSVFLPLILNSHLIFCLNLKIRTWRTKWIHTVVRPPLPLLAPKGPLSDNGSFNLIVLLLFLFYNRRLLFFNNDWVGLVFEI